MSRVPTEQMKKAMTEILTTDTNVKVFGKNKEHKIYYAYDVNEDVETFIYEHYKTACLCVDYEPSTGKQCVFIYAGAYSSTDRDNMNGMLYMLGIDRVKVYKEHDKLFFMFEGHKTRLKDIILK